MAVAILIHPLSVKFWISQILLSYLPNSSVRNYIFFILLRYYSFKKPKCFCSKQNTNANPKYRSGEAKNDPLEQFVCLQSLNIRIDMTQCVTSA